MKRIPYEDLVDLLDLHRNECPDTDCPMYLALEELVERREVDQATGKGLTPKDEALEALGAQHV